VVFGIRHGSIPGYVAAVRQNAGKIAMIGETRVLANCGYGTPICQTLNQAHNPREFGKKTTKNVHVRSRFT
jgi:hypothetical protein